MILDKLCFLFKRETCLLHLWIASWLEFDPHFGVMIILPWSSFSVASLSDIVFHHTFVFFCSFCPCSAAAGCQENQGLSLCLQHTTCVHNIESPVCRVFSDTWQSLCTIAPSPLSLWMKVNCFQQFDLTPFPLNLTFSRDDTVKKRTSLFYCV